MHAGKEIIHRQYKCYASQNKIIYRQYNIQVYASQNRNNNGQKENTGVARHTE
jgi:hypothetical protein